MVKESWLFCHNFARLLTFLGQVGKKKQRQVVRAVAYLGLRLRDLCSIFNRFKLEETYVEQLQSAAQEYYRVPCQCTTVIHLSKSHFLDHRPRCAHSYQAGLWGREAKHIGLQKLSANTTYQH